MGLDYLNKKVWHPGSMKNIQQVWQAQQAQLEVIKHQRQRAKKLQDQHHNQEMKRIQVEAGLIPKSHLDRMDWMYDWGNKLQQQKNSQQFLTGEKKVGATDKKQKHIFQEQATNLGCEQFVLLHQDPLYAIKRQEMKARQKIMDNPLEMKNIIRQVEQEYLKRKPTRQISSSKSKTSKSSKRHKQKKQKKKSSRRNSRSDSESPQRFSRKSSKRSKRQHSSSSDSSLSNERRSRQKKSSQSALYNEYLKNTFGNILKKDEDGNLIPDYGMHRQKYKTQAQLDEQERRKRLEDMRNNAKDLKDKRYRQSQYEKEYSDSRKDKHRDYQGDYNQGLANIRSQALKGSKENRNHRRYRSPSE